jgi:hypothetical protein
MVVLVDARQVLTELAPELILDGDLQATREFSCLGERGSPEYSVGDASLKL